ncbi:DMT family transporter [Vibrio sp. vnigr-6D03]|nr:DMT family transporter [Vibrio sp. vnigr-6D03]
MINAPFSMSVVMVVAGIGIPFMATLNNWLGVKLGNPVAASGVFLSMA